MTGTPKFGSLTDETGSISCSHPPSPLNVFRPLKSTHRPRLKTRSSSPLLWSPEAWHQLLGRDALDIITGNETSSNELSKTMAHLQYLESRLLFLRITVVFGWYGRDGKLAICRVLD